MNAPTRPLPLLTAQNELYWTSGADGRLRFQRCVARRGLVHPPKPACPYCRGGATEIAEVSGEGTLSADSSRTGAHMAWVSSTRRSPSCAAMPGPGK